MAKGTKGQSVQESALKGSHNLVQVHCTSLVYPLVVVIFMIIRDELHVESVRRCAKVT